MLTTLHDGTPLPPTHLALGVDSEAPGLLAVGGRLTLQRLEEAYRHGIFPWYGPGQPPLWWSPDPRMVLRVADFEPSRSLRKTLAKVRRGGPVEVRVDTAFRAVIGACAATPRHGRSGTWIVPELLEAYCAWHAAGVAHSVETWADGELVGGLYGVGLGRMFYGESMFAHRTDASKIALAALVCLCREHGIALVDCQQHTDHLASLGAREIPRAAFEAHLARATALPPVPDWAYHPALWRHLDSAGSAPAEQAPR